MIALDFIRRAKPRELRVMLALTMVGGLANAALVVMVNVLSATIGRGGLPHLTGFILFTGAFLIYYGSNRLALVRAHTIVERLLKELRLQVFDTLRHCELAVVDSLGRGNLFTLIAHETNRISVAFPVLVDSFQQAILLSVSLLYLAWLSPVAFAAFLLSAGLGYIGYRSLNEDFRGPVARGLIAQGDLLDAVGDTVDGFKELRLNSKRRMAARVAFSEISEAVEVSRDASGQQWAAMIMLGNVVTYFMLGVVVFVLPGYVSSQHQIIFQLVPTLLFCLGPLAKLVVQAPMFMQAEIGLRGILDVERQMGAVAPITTAASRDLAAHFADFQRIDYQDLILTRRHGADETGFTLGPITLSLIRGETLLLLGGNGSGKSTALRLCTGLLAPDSGQILVDGRPVTGAAVGGFRELFATVFVDFHLFDRLYGLEHIDPAIVQSLLVEMGLDHKVRFENGVFSDLALSTGQRKRLGLITALLEDRPVIVFDEWSAEQDAEFRDYFYRTIIPRLKAQGKTILMVTHDDRYLGCADRIIQMELGRIVSSQDEPISF